VIDELRKIIRTGVNAADLAKIKEQQRRKLETDLRQNQYWLNNLYDAYYLGIDPSKAIFREKQIESLTGKMIQDVAKKYINLSAYIRGVLMPEKTGDKLKPF
jgi:zinc protease